MNEPKRKLHIANELLGDERSVEAENRSLASSLTALRRRSRRRRLIARALPAAVAASLLAGLPLFRTPVPPDVARDNRPEPSHLVQTRPPSEDMIVQSRHSAEIVVSRQTIEADVSAQTGRSRSEITVVTSAPSNGIDFMDTQQLLAAFEKRPVMLAEAADGEWRVFLLDERDREFLWEP